MSESRTARDLGENGRFLTTAHAKRRIRFDAETATYWVRDGAIRGLKIGGGNNDATSVSPLPLPSPTPPPTSTSLPPLPTSKVTAAATAPTPTSTSTPVTGAPTTTASSSLPPMAPKKKQQRDDDLLVTPERDELYCLALAHILYANHNGNKNGPVGIYPDRKSQRAEIQVLDPRLSANVQMYQVLPLSSSPILPPYYHDGMLLNGLSYGVL